MLVDLIKEVNVFYKRRSSCFLHAQMLNGIALLLILANSSTNNSPSGTPFSLFHQFAGRLLVHGVLKAPGLPSPASIPGSHLGHCDLPTSFCHLCHESSCRLYLASTQSSQDFSYCHIIPFQPIFYPSPSPFQSFHVHSTFNFAFVTLSLCPHSVLENVSSLGFLYGVMALGI